MQLFSSSKGITPLVATILLVAFSVGLGALVMSWGEEYIAEKAEFVQGTAEVKSGCDAAAIQLIRISGTPQACIGPEGINLWIDNGPNVDLYNIHARIVGPNGVDVIEDILEQPLLKANAVKTTIPINPQLGGVTQVRLTPKFWTGKDIALCSQNALEIERIKQC
jgi:hypothetical protein